ncbi:lipoprotein [Mesoplasma lactucae]|uniref:Uncharacterized protein n=1 Tax=Mesoplasma lactucae ATCC 49193 TaxID=81460 RepID=A0A291IRI5_9MOLU|nr:lipoprotein [Mesoplasma lactucae]ATG97307.1 hypothetical protein CP520_00845 [Mesoplasma lactucae ATCC 49193]ATZ20243.1 hypothetical protein MLACT_v1c04220 [Mesoplasma lactucae ATCC 49193]MCL8216992.1 hypothetical protein [Mesoplasma lactucae ATCC 49193]
MKKLLSILGAVGLTATASSAVVSCSNTPDVIAKTGSTATIETKKAEELDLVKVEKVEGIPTGLYQPGVNWPTDQSKKSLTLADDSSKTYKTTTKLQYKKANIIATLTLDGETGKVKLAIKTDKDLDTYSLIKFTFNNAAGTNEKSVKIGFKAKQTEVLKELTGADTSVFYDGAELQFADNKSAPTEYELAYKDINGDKHEVPAGTDLTIDVEYKEVVDVTTFVKDGKMFVKVAPKGHDGQKTSVKVSGAGFNNLSFWVQVG